MSSNFKPLGQTTLANATTTSSQVYVLSNRPVSSWLITNAGANDVFFRISTSSSVTATVPTIAGQSQPGQLINAGDAYIIGLPEADGAGTGAYVANVTIAANAISSTSQLFITPVQQF